MAATAPASPPGSSTGAPTQKRSFALPAIGLFVVLLALFALVILGLVAASGGDPKPRGTVGGPSESGSSLVSRAG